MGENKWERVGEGEGEREFGMEVSTGNLQLQL